MIKYSTINSVISKTSLKDYILLMKPRVMSLVVFTSYCGMSLAPGNISPLLIAAAIFFISVGAGAAASINMWYDCDIDCIMERTQKRPTITGAILPREALVFGIIIAVISVLFMAICINMLSSILLAFTILYYVFIYTMWLKRSSIHNVVIGGVSGAIPPLIGWSSVTGSLSWEAITLFAIIFMWTPPHSWALALFRSDDYKKCKIPMMPVIKGNLYTKKQILLYTILMIIASSSPYFFGIAGLAYFMVSLVLGLIFLIYVVMLFKDNNPSRPKSLFKYSIIYLFSIFLMLLI